MVRYKKQQVLQFSLMLRFRPWLLHVMFNSHSPSVHELTQDLLTSTDDMVLVQMGAIPEGLTSEEGDHYANGLRRIIQEIRGRKVRDFNVVASEITAYRAQFLADTSKLLPL